MKENTMETMNNFPFDSQYGVGDMDDGIVFRPCDDGGLTCLWEKSSWEEICGELNDACEVFYARGRSSLQGELDAAREEALRYRKALEMIVSGKFVNGTAITEFQGFACAALVEADSDVALSQPTVPTKKEGEPND